MLSRWRGGDPVGLMVVAIVLLAGLCSRLPELMRWLDGPVSDEQVRVSCLLARRFPHPERERRLLTLLRELPDGLDRRLVANTLGDVGTSESVPDLIAVQLTARHGDVRKAAMISAARIGERRAAGLREA